MIKLLATIFLCTLYTTDVCSQDTLGLRSVIIQRDFKTSFPSPVSPIPANYYAKHLGFFCKQEINAEKNNIPVKVRLGSFDYCNWMESKPGSTVPLQKR